ncbi:MAG: esterase-like activity of phytase family protein [Proteobacteria bacterium]|nr:MAG: esterase-like activity of phytase family protein [Pseudomonadota bacterium]
MIRFVLDKPPAVGTTAAGQEIALGGFSGLRYLGTSPEGKLRFLTLTDRGPNADEYEVGEETHRPFLIPDYQPRLIFLEADITAGTLTVEKQILLTRPAGKKFSGLPQRKGMEVPVTAQGETLPFDPQGGDTEGVGLMPDGSFWIAEEYGPSLLHFSAAGELVETLKPGNGLPKVLENRRLNRGFEGFAVDGNIGYAIVQSPLDNPVSKGAKNSKDSRIVRIIAVDLEEKRTEAQYAYILESSKTDKIGDLAVEAPGVLLVVERDGKAGPKSSKKVFRVKLEGATNLQLLSDRVVGKGGSLELTKPEALAKLKITPVAKEEVVDLTRAGILPEKVEGIDIAGDYLAFCTDNDFGLAGGLDRKTGLAELKEEKPMLFLLPKEVWRK